MIAQDIYSLLSANSTLTSNLTEIYQYAPEQNPAMPFMVYSVSDPQIGLMLRGSTNIAEYKVDLEAFLLTESSQELIYDTLISVCHGYANGTILLMQLTGGSLDNLETTTGETVYGIKQNYKVITQGV